MRITHHQTKHVLSCSHSMGYSVPQIVIYRPLVNYDKAVWGKEEGKDKAYLSFPCDLECDHLVSLSHDG